MVDGETGDRRLAGDDARRRFLTGSLLSGLSGAFVTTIGCLPQETKRAQAAEDPDKDFRPAAGRVDDVHFAGGPGVRGHDRAVLPYECI